MAHKYKIKEKLKTKID